MKQIITIVSLLFSLSSLAQGYDPEKVNKKAAALYSKALDYINNDRPREAIPDLLEAIKTDSRFEDAYLTLGGVYGDMRNYAAAVDCFVKAKAIDSVYFREFNLPFSINLAGMGSFQQALDAIEIFLRQPRLNERSRKAGEFRKKTYLFALDFAKKNSNNNYVFTPKNMGENINTRFSEYFPSVTLDGKTLVFTRRVDHINEDFFETVRDSNTWGKSFPLPGDINSEQNEGAQHISQDGKWLVFTGCNFPRGAGSCDLYVSILTNKGWSEPESLGSSINTESWESQPCLSPDNRDLYFVSNRPGGLGGSDIYISRRLPNGRWGAPENLGPSVNTAGDESTPFIHADNQSLYFSSNGWTGYGDNDIFVARKQGNSWQTPENLGYPINTIGNEGSLFIAADGKTVYYASDRTDTKGGLDIYTFELRESVRPYKTLWVKGRVYDKKTNAGLPSLLSLTDLNSKLIISQVQTDAEGNYLLTLPVGKDYAFNVNRKGYLLFSENYSLSKNATDSVYQKNIPLQPIELNAAMVLKNIFFDFKKFDLKPESQVELDQLVLLLKDNPTVKILINGYTDSIGKTADNLKLSNNRARAVVDYLITKGVNPGRLSFKGWGAAKPLASNKTEEGRAQNRRTEMVVTGK
jgi:outer membrane protein OmpA-like peptidoglycan-associated protein